MKARLEKLMAGIIICIAILMMSKIKVNAASASVNISSVSGSIGDTVGVDVVVTSDTLASANLLIGYDTNFLELVSVEGGDAGGTAGVLNTVIFRIEAGKSEKVTINFRLKQAGSTGVSVLDTTSVAEMSATVAPEDAAMNITKTNGTVNIKAATSASSDSHLAGFVVQAVSQSGDSQTVSYSPSFSPEVYDYKADLPANTVKLVISTTLSDKNSTTKVSGTRIDPGDNKTTITVVAEDGTQSKYTLYTTRPSENETTTNPESPQESSSELQTTDFDRSPKLISNINKYIIQDFSLVSVPEGFEESTTTYNGETVAAVKGIAKELTLLCLADDAQGSNASFYIYNEISGAIDKMINITTSQKIYTIIPTGDDYVGPEGYTKTELDINGEKVSAWVKTPDSGFYVVYAMNWDGEKALYIYDSKEQTMQRFVEGAKSESVDDEPGEENKEYLAMKRKYDDMYDEYVNDHSKKNRIIIILGIIVIGAAIGIAALIYKLRTKKSGFNDENNEDEEDELEEIGSEQGQKELKLDMVAQVNEMKAEKLAAQINEMLNESESDDNEVESDEEISLNEAEDSSNEANENKSVEAEAIEDESHSDEIENSITDNSEEEVADKNSAEDENVKPEMKFTKEEPFLSGGQSKENNGKDKENDKSSENEPYLINMEDDDPFEIEFVDLNDGDDTK